MIRKQLYITDYQDRALKRTAKRLGVSEAELVRRALDEFLREADDAPRRDVLEQLLANTRRLAERHRFPAHYRFDRAELYAEREDRLFESAPRRG